jgi:hypothetical protein
VKVNGVQVNATTPLLFETFLSMVTAMTAMLSS